MVAEMKPTHPVPAAAQDRNAEQATRRLALALCDPVCFPYAVASVELIETHISYVLVAGAYAYKIKKPVNLGFLDFTALEARRWFCEEELRLNSRTAPELYLNVVAITGTHDRPVLGGRGEPIEYAVRMRAFPQDMLCDRIARRGELRFAHMHALAAAVARFHMQAARAEPESRYGGGAAILEAAQQNFTQVAGLPGVDAERARIATLAAWTEREHSRLAGTFARRRHSGFVRECHGDLHLGNLALVAGAPLIFDAIEFNPELRWIDVMSDVAFLHMDLLDHGLDALASRFLNTWLELAGDYEGLAVLRFYGVYRAMVRAKVACLRVNQPGVSTPVRESGMAQFRGYLGLAERLTRPPPVLLGITSGLSGSGKSIVARAIVEQLGAIRLRSDVERKRLAGLAAAARTGSGAGQGIYSAAADRTTYQRLWDLAAAVVGADYAAVVDATFTRRRDRAAFSALAAGLNVPFAIVACTAPMESLRERVLHRQRNGQDASEATLEVLECQAGSYEALTAEERDAAVMVDTDREAPPFAAAIAALTARLGGPPPAA